MKAHLCTLLLLASAAHQGRAQQTALDSTFGQQGIVAPGQPARLMNNKLAVTQDGRIVVAGTYYYSILPSFDLVYEMRVMRFLPDGRPDSSFNGTGMLTRLDVPRSTRITGLNLQPDGKLLVTGSTGFIDRYLPDGTPDSTFSDSGRVTLPYLGPYDFLEGTTVQPNGKVMVTGRLWQQFLLVARFLPDGQPDATWGLNGLVATTLEQTNSSAGTAVLTRPDGRILVAGYSIGAGPAYPHRCVVVCYQDDGYFEPTFNGGKGYIQYTFPGVSHAHASSLIRYPDGRLLVGGDGYNPTSAQRESRPCIARLTAAGVPDLSFNTTGLLVCDSIAHGGGNYFSAAQYALQADGKFLVAHAVPAAGLHNRQFTVRRYQSGGAPDAAFGGNSTLLTDLSPHGDVPSGMALQADGKILVSGISNKDTGWEAFNIGALSIVRYHPNVTLGLRGQPAGMRDVQVFPNPATTALRVRFAARDAGPVAFSLLDGAGRTVQRWSTASFAAGMHTETLRLGEHIPPGLYFLAISGQEGLTVIKIEKR